MHFAGRTAPKHLELRVGGTLPVLVEHARANEHALVEPEARADGFDVEAPIAALESAEREPAQGRFPETLPIRRSEAPVPAPRRVDGQEQRAAGRVVAGHEQRSAAVAILLEGVRQEHLASSLGALDGEEPVEASQAVLVFPEAAVGLQVGLEARDLVGRGGVLELRVEGALGGGEPGAAGRVELDRQQHLERRAREGARVVELARLHGETTTRLDEGHQGLDERGAVLFRAGDAARVDVAEDHHVVVVEQLLARLRQRQERLQVAARLLGEVGGGRAQEAAHLDVRVAALEELLQEAILPARVAIHVQDADRLGRDAHAEAHLVVVRARFLLEGRHAHQEVAHGLRCALLGAGDQGQACTGFGELDLGFVEDPTRLVGRCGELLQTRGDACARGIAARAANQDLGRDLVSGKDRVRRLDQLDRDSRLAGRIADRERVHRHAERDRAARGIDERRTAGHAAVADHDGGGDVARGVGAEGAHEGVPEVRRRSGGRELFDAIVERGPTFGEREALLQVTALGEQRRQRFA